MPDSIFSPQTIFTLPDGTGAGSGYAQAPGSYSYFSGYAPYDQNYGLGGYNYNLNWFADTPSANGYGAGGFEMPNMPWFPDATVPTFDSSIGVAPSMDLGYAFNPWGQTPDASNTTGSNPFNIVTGGPNDLRIPADATTLGAPGTQVASTGTAEVIDPEGLYGHQGGGTAGGGLLGSLGNLNQGGPNLIFIPGVGLVEAALASILLSRGIPDLLSGGGGGQGLLDNVEQLITHPVQEVDKTITNIGNQTGLTTDSGGLTNSGLVVGGAGAIAGAGNTPNSSSGTTGTNPGDPANNDTQGAGSTSVFPVGGNNSSSGATSGAAAGAGSESTPSTAVVGGPTQNGDTGYPQTENKTPNTKVLPPLNIPKTSGPGGTWTPAETSNITPNVVTPITAQPPTAPTPTTPTTPTIVLPTPTPTMPTTPVIGNGTQRDFYQEGLLGINALNSLTPNLTNVYGNASRAYGQADYRNFGDILAQYGITNAGLGQIANNQTVTSNTALRTGNVQDAAALGGQALGILQNLNPNQYAALNQAQARAGQDYGLARAGALLGTMGPSDTQKLLEKQTSDNLALGGQLSAQDLNQAQQAAREAWGARGLINSKGAIGAEILNTDALARQRLAERQQAAAAVDATGFAQRQQGYANALGYSGANNASYGNVLQNAALQTQSAFNPFNTITSANTQNQGTNAALYGQIGGLSSGQMGNQLAQQQYYPWTSYAGDVYGTNVNAQLARDISNANNAAAIQGANTQGNASLLSSVVNGLFSLYKNQPATVAGTSCWVAREVYGVSNPKWMLFREWMLNRSPRLFRATYLAFGERFANWLRRHPSFKPAIRRFMDSRIATL